LDGCHASVLPTTRTPGRDPLAGDHLRRASSQQLGEVTSPHRANAPYAEASSFFEEMDTRAADRATATQEDGTENPSEEAWVVCPASAATPAGVRRCWKAWMPAARRSASWSSSRL